MVKFVQFVLNNYEAHNRVILDNNVLVLIFSLLVKREMGWEKRLQYDYMI